MKMIFLYMNCVLWRSHGHVAFTLKVLAKMGFPFRKTTKIGFISNDTKLTKVDLKLLSYFTMFWGLFFSVLSVKDPVGALDAHLRHGLNRILVIGVQKVE